LTESPTPHPVKSATFNEKAKIVENDIANALSQIDPEDDNPASWTKAVNEILQKTAKESDRNYLAASKAKDANNSEWLYDFVWYDNNDNGDLNDVFLIAESEWKNPLGNGDYAEDVQYDFEKLIVGRAEYRLMIFEGNDMAEINPNVGQMMNVVKRCKLTKPGDRYMFAVWNTQVNDFHFDLYVA